MKKDLINGFYLTENKKYTFIALSLCKFIHGIACLAVAPLLIKLGQVYEINLELLSLVFAFSYLGQIIIVFFVGFFADRMGRKIFHIIFVMLFALTSLAFVFLNNYILFLLLFLLLGLFGAAVNMIPDSTIIDTFKVRRSYYLNIAHIFFGLGAATAPVIYILVFKITGDFRSIYFVLFLISIFVLLMIIPAKYPVEYDEKVRAVIIINMLKKPRLLLINIFSILTFGTVISISGWVPTLFQKYLTMSEDISNYSVSFFWLAVIIGRGVAALLSKKYSEVSLIKIINVVIFFLLSISFFIENPMLLLADYLLLGFFMGTFAPLIISYTAELYKWHSNTRVAVTTSAASFGMFLLPTIVGIIGEHFSINKVISFAGMFFFIFIFIFWKYFKE